VRFVRIRLKKTMMRRSDVDYVPKVGDWILYSSDYGLKMGIVRYIREPKTFSETIYYTDSDRVVASEILEIRT
jgi:hypothetical protein